eukprot:9733206-Alexandrium_andersonii.AAC.1
MSASLVGSEMCIRDRHTPSPEGLLYAVHQLLLRERSHTGKAADPLKHRTLKACNLKLKWPRLSAINQLNDSEADE